MPRWIYVVFFAVVATVAVGTHYYLYRRLIVAPGLPPPWRTVATVALVVGCVCFPVSFMVQRALPIHVARVFLFPMYVWVGMMLMLLAALVAIDIGRGVAWLGMHAAGRQGLDPERRLFFVRVIAGGVAGLVAVASSAAVWRGVSKLVVRRIDVALDGLAASLDGFKIVQLTDTHLCAMRGGGWWRSVVERTNALEPDLIAITGDLADVAPSQLPGELEALAELRAAHGIFFVTGNHEYFIDLEGWLSTLAGMGVRVLRNERVPITRGDGAFDLAGVDDHDGGRFVPHHGPDVGRAMDGRDPKRPVVLLAHQPRVIDEAARHGVNLVLSGHTHGGQIWPWSYAVYLQQPYISGMHHRLGTQIYVSEGTGFWGPPMRQGTTSEITLVTLRRSA